MNTFETNSEIKIEMIVKWYLIGSFEGWSLIVILAEIFEIRNHMLYATDDQKLIFLAINTNKCKLYLPSLDKFKLLISSTQVF